VANGEWRVANGEWRVAIGDWRVAIGECACTKYEIIHLHERGRLIFKLMTFYSPLVIRHSPL